MVTNIISSIVSRFIRKPLVVAEGNESEGGDLPPSPEAQPQPQAKTETATVVITAAELIIIQHAFSESNKGVPLDRCNLYIGCESVGSEVRQDIRKHGNTFRTTPVSYVSGAVGALMLMPNYKATLLKTAKAAPKKVKVKSTKPKLQQQQQTKKEETKDAN